MQRLSWQHLDRLTDDFGIWQHTIGREIDRQHGYALDDNARALLLAVRAKNREKIAVYLAFLDRAIQTDRIVNFYGPDRSARDVPWSEDALGESYWAIAECSLISEFNNKCENIILRMRSFIDRFTSMRGLAYSALGEAVRDRSRATKLIEVLSTAFQQNRRPDWLWPEDRFTYANALLPLALLKTGFAVDSTIYKTAGLSMLTFLNQVTKYRGKPIAIGNQGWFERGEAKALFDQQPIDPAMQVLANVAAFQVTDDPHWLDEADTYFSWFWGNNLLDMPLVDLTDESCRDGLGQTGVDQNRGSENIVCYLLAEQAYWPYYVKRMSTIQKEAHVSTRVG